ncbi:MAG: HD domain-containing phosphohydrolase [Lachnospiraceae bacterium]
MKPKGDTTVKSIPEKKGILHEWEMEDQNIMNEKAEQDVLLIADNETNRTALKNIFQDSYQIEEAENGVQCLQKLQEQKNHICALILNVNMPGMDGMRVMETLNAQGVPVQIPVFLMVRGKNESIIKQGYQLGAMDVITKPLLPYVVQRRVDSAVELYRSRYEMRCLIESQERQLIAKELEITEANKGTIEALATAIEIRSGESGQHVRRISDITRYLLTYTFLGEGMEPDTVEQIAIAAILHDIGKISIPDTILNKPDKLTPKEYAIMKTHTIHGAEILGRVPQLRNQKIFRYAYDIAKHHHERWDGNGYPDGLKGNEVAIWTQIVAVADVYDALVSKRVYKEAYDYETALQMIVEGQCGVFNPELIRCFLDSEKELRGFYE